MVNTTFNKEEVFQAWLADHPDFEKKIVKENSRWGRILCKWDEKKQDGEILTHHFAACVNLKNGDVYLDCRKRKLLAKNITLSVFRPIHAVIKTIYHACLAGVIVSIIKGIRHKESTKTILKNCAKSLADIVRTPFYGTVLTVINIASVILAAFSPKSLYDMRDIQGRIEQRLNWGEKHTGWTLARCFQSAFNICGDELGASAKKQIKVQEQKEALKPKIEDLKQEIYSDAGAHRNAKKIKRLHKLEKKYYTCSLEAAIKSYGDVSSTVYSSNAQQHITDFLDGLHKSRKLMFKAKTPELKAQRAIEAQTLDETLVGILPKVEEEAVVNHRLTNFAARMIWDRRWVGCNPFYQIGKMSPEKVYQSAAITSNKLLNAQLAVS